MFLQRLYGPCTIRITQQSQLGHSYSAKLKKSAQT